MSWILLNAVIIIIILKKKSLTLLYIYYIYIYYIVFGIWRWDRRVRGEIEMTVWHDNEVHLNVIWAFLLSLFFMHYLYTV